MGKNGFDFVKIDKTVIKETKYITTFVAIFSVLMQAIFLIIGKWHFTMLFGNLWGAAVAIGNFFVMGLYIQKAVSQDEKEARQTMKGSLSMRFAALVLLTGIGIAVFYNHNSWITVAAPLVFPSFAIYLRPLFDRNKK